MVEHTTENRGVGGSIPPLTTHAPTLVLLCAPSLGILDNWLPVLHAARRSQPDCRIVALIPDRETLAQLDASDTAHVLADEVIDATLVPLHGGGWMLADGFLSAVDAARPRRLLPRLRTRAQRARSTDPSALAGPDSRVLYDIHLHKKAGLGPLLDVLGNTPRFSHNHGIELEASDALRVAPKDPENVRAAFVYGPSEIEPYAHNFGLESSAMEVVGIVRHEPTWVRRVIERSRSLHTLPFEDFVLIVSRSAGSTYLPRDRKVAALRALHQVAWREHGLPLVLRTHPKEHEDGTLADAFPAEEEGVSWALSRAHPFHLATRSRLGVTFLSGVSVDLVALGVPVVEYLDIRGLPDLDNDTTERDLRGRPMFSPYRRDGLVTGVDDIAGLREAVGQVDGDRERLVATQKQAHALRFIRAGGSSEHMLARIVGRTGTQQERR